MESADIVGNRIMDAHADVARRLGGLAEDRRHDLHCKDASAKHAGVCFH